MVFGYIADFSSGSSNILGVYEHGESLLLHLKNNRIDPLVGFCVALHFDPRRADCGVKNP